MICSEATNCCMTWLIRNRGHFPGRSHSVEQLSSLLVNGKAQFDDENMQFKSMPTQKNQMHGLLRTGIDLYLQGLLCGKRVSSLCPARHWVWPTGNRAGLLIKMHLYLYLHLHESVQTIHIQVQITLECNLRRIMSCHTFKFKISQPFLTHFVDLCALCSQMFQTNRSR